MTSTDKKVLACALLPVGLALSGLSFSIYNSRGKFSEPPRMETKTSGFHTQKVAEVVTRYSSRGALPHYANISIACYDWKAKKFNCQINSTEQMQLASVVKVFIAAAYLKQSQLDPIKFPLNNEVITNINLMIVDSDNNIANKLIYILGGVSNVCSLLKNIGIECNIIEEIPKNGTTYKNTSSVENIVKLYELLLEDKLQGSRIVLDALRHSKRSRMFEVKGTTIDHGNKTGTTDFALNDSGFLGNLIIIVMVSQEKPDRINRSALSGFHAEVARIFLNEIK